jgi:hypothetical protein
VIAVLKERMATAYFMGLLYFLAVFALAFATGITRELVIAPRLGPTPAVLLEVPILVLASWIAALRLLRNRSLSLQERAVMGATGFALTMASEVALAMMMRGQSIADWAAAVVAPLGLAGLGAQVVFAVMPMFVGHSRTAT